MEAAARHRTAVATSFRPSASIAVTAQPDTAMAGCWLERIGGQLEDFNEHQRFCDCSGPAPIWYPSAIVFSRYDRESLVEVINRYLAADPSEKVL